MLIRLFILLGFSSCVFAGVLPPLADTLRGSQNFGEHVMIYGDNAQQFIWGIVFPHDTLTSLSNNTVRLRSGVTLAFVTNEVTIANSTNKITMTLKPQTIYLMHDDLSRTSSSDLSGIRLVPTRVWSRWVNDYITTYDLVLPDNLPKRFGKRAF